MLLRQGIQAAPCTKSFKCRYACESDPLQYMLPNVARMMVHVPSFETQKPCISLLAELPWPSQTVNFLGLLCVLQFQRASGVLNQLLLGLNAMIGAWMELDRAGMTMSPAFCCSTVGQWARAACHRATRCRNYDDCRFLPIALEPKVGPIILSIYCKPQSRHSLSSWSPREGKQVMIMVSS